MGPYKVLRKSVARLIGILTRFFWCLIRCLQGIIGFF